MNWQGIVGFRLVTTDLDRATAFYQALGFSLAIRRPISPAEMALLRLGGSGTRQSMTLGSAQVDLDIFGELGRPYPADADAAALCFQHLALVTDDAALAFQRAKCAGATPISRRGAVTLPASSGGVTAVKFRDPDGHPLEFLQFADGAAQGWPGNGLLGVDHSAISVSDVTVSRRFYVACGLSEQGASLNKGPAQELLDGLDDVSLEVVPLLPIRSTPHLELLGYQQPRRRQRGSAAPNDVAATRIVWRAGRREILADPDGHLHQLEDC